MTLTTPPHTLYCSLLSISITYLFCGYKIPYLVSHPSINPELWRHLWTTPKFENGGKLKKSRSQRFEEFQIFIRHSRTRNYPPCPSVFARSLSLCHVKTRIGNVRYNRYFDGAMLHATEEDEDWPWKMFFKEKHSNCCKLQWAAEIYVLH